jgi:hypothetical protein
VVNPYATRSRIKAVGHDDFVRLEEQGLVFVTQLLLSPERSIRREKASV